MWPELAVVYLTSLKAKGYSTGDIVGDGRYGELILDMLRYPPEYLTGEVITPETLREVALYRIKERIKDENNK